VPRPLRSRRLPRFPPSSSVPGDPGHAHLAQLRPPPVGLRPCTDTGRGRPDDHARPLGPRRMGAPVRGRARAAAGATPAGRADGGRGRVPHGRAARGAQPVLGLPVRAGRRGGTGRGPAVAGAPADAAVAVRARARPAGVGRAGADPAGVRHRGALPGPAADAARGVPRDAGGHAVRPPGRPAGPGRPATGPARRGRAGGGHRAVGGRGGTGRLPGMALPRVPHGRGGDRGDGGRGRPEGEPRGQGASGGDRGRAGGVRGRRGAPAARQRCSRDRAGSGSGAPPIQSWNARRGPSQRRSWR
jgi:hypothetical protein